jgi:ABC-type cobalamin/Fe3+-siderophores transport system ATPase subunit
MIERLYVQNFRCLESFTLDLASNSSALIIGRNGSGKSTIRHALGVLQRIGRGSGRVDTLIEPEDYSFYDQYWDQQGRFKGTDKPMRFEIELTIAGKRFVYAISFDWPANFREARILDEALTVDAQPVFTRQQSQVSLPGSNSFGLDWHVFALSVINEKPPATSIQDFKAFLASLVLMAPVPAQMDGFSETTTDRLGGEALNFASCLRSLLEKKPAVYGVLESFLRSAISDFSSLDHEDRGKAGKQLMVAFKRPDTNESFRIKFDGLSDGEKCFFLCAYIVASTSVGLPIYCFWDEPDNHLSLSEVGQFMTTLRKSAKRGGQFIATSHHPETVRKFSSESTYVLNRKSHLDPTLLKLLKDLSYNGDLVEALIRNEVIG